jgi:predicted Zn-dependent protease
MKAGKILLLGIGVLSIYGCAHTGPRPQRNEAPPTATTANDPTTRSLSLLQMADMAKASGDRTSAAQLYSEAVNLQPANGVAWFGLGTNYLHQNDVDLAVVALREAVRRDPSMQKAWSNLAVAHLEQFRRAARNALSGSQVTQVNRDALSSLLAAVDRTLGASTGPTAVAR